MDTKTKAKTAAAKLPQSLLDLNKPSLHALSYALRHPDTWPDGFNWNYLHCEECAMGLAHHLWVNSIPQTNAENAASIMAKRFAMPYTVANGIFMGIGKKWRPAYSVTKYTFWTRKPYQVEFYHISKDITPDMVADRIDKYLAEAE